MDEATAFDPASAPCGWLRFSDEGALLQVNDELCSMVGQEAAALAGQHIEVLLTGTSRIYFHMHVEPALRRQGRLAQVALALAGRGGAALPVLFNAVRRPGPGGAVTEAVVVGLDERTALEDALLRVRKAAEMVPGAIFQLLARPDGTLCVPYASPGLKAVCGLLPGQVREDAGALVATIHPDDRARWLAPLHGLAEGELRDTFRLAGAGGEPRWVERHARPEALGGGGVLWHGYLFDVTERHALEAARRDQAAAEQASVAKTEFLQTMSHELRTPLNAVLGLSEALLESVYGSVNERQRTALTRIGDSGRHLLALINDVLDLAKVEAGRVELERAPVDVADLCRASVRLVEGAAHRRGIDVGWSAAPGLPTFAGDPRRLKQVLVNLLGNAVKFTPAGGHVRLHAAPGPAPDTVELTVVDQGIGIAPADHDRLFQPFVQLDSGLAREHTGTGLGLALARQIVELHGGTVRVESALGAGARFTVTLPLGRAEAGEVGPERASEPGPARHEPGPRRILLAEDDESNVATVIDFLQARGFAVTVARDGREAVDLARRLQPDAILMDVQMPLLDGLAATRALRADASARVRGTPILLVTAMAMAGDEERCRAAGADAYLTKPVRLKVLLATIEAHLAARADGPGA